ncbi:hypothetical protein KGM_215297 [Danaus plexippus plexippus]|uniref:Uncharacterized protein n=1 Tax=Danaus plexippus plexippus TaxID=278856 RepID=A0A212F5F4_DANPL|nr:hypothetical protein KGM_215297 [Danaus plexippus plexippus]
MYQRASGVVMKIRPRPEHQQESLRDMIRCEEERRPDGVSQGVPASTFIIVLITDECSILHLHYSVCSALVRKPNSRPGALRGSGRVLSSETDTVFKKRHLLFRPT